MCLKLDYEIMKWITFFRSRVCDELSRDADGPLWCVLRSFLICRVIINCSEKALYCGFRNSLFYAQQTVLPLHACSVAAPAKQCPAHSASTAGSMEGAWRCGCTGQPMALWLRHGLVHQWPFAHLGKHKSWFCVGIAVSMNLLTCHSLSSAAELFYREDMFILLCPQ